MGFEFPVDLGQVLIFARSVGDLDPVYDSQLLDAGDGAPLVVPPTFVRSAEHFDPDSVGRPQLPTHAPGRGGGGDTVHAEHHFEYFEALHAGDILKVETLTGETWTKRGRSGLLEFVETVTEFRNQAGELNVRERKVSVRMSRQDDDD